MNSISLNSAQAGRLRQQVEWYVKMEVHFLNTKTTHNSSNRCTSPGKK